MISATFEVKEHKEYGSMGLAMVGRNWAEPLTDMAIPHDMLEHFPGDTGTPEEELMALSAMFYVRNDTEYGHYKGFWNTNSVKNFVGEMPMQQGYMQSAGQTRWRDPGKTLPLRDKEAEEYIQDAVRKTSAFMFMELDRSWDNVIPAFKEANELQKMIGWMRRGYRKAVRRYKGLSPSEVCYLFIQIEGEAMKFLKHAYEGQRCRITCSLEKQRIWLEELYNDEDY